jgi:hypothetical protein
MLPPPSPVEVAYGGNRWDATFLDTFRYLDQLGRLARTGVHVVMHNTLAASDYGLLDEKTLAPDLRQLMGTTEFDAGVLIQAGLHVYAHCQETERGTTNHRPLLTIKARFSQVVSKPFVDRTAANCLEGKTANPIIQPPQESDHCQRKMVDRSLANPLSLTVAEAMAALSEHGRS